MEQKSIYVQVEYYADGFYSGLMRFNEDALLWDESTRRKCVHMLIHNRHPMAKHVDDITTKIVKPKPEWDELPATLS